LAENKDGQDKTEDATAKRLHDSRMKGQVSKSTDVTTSAILLIGGGILILLGSNIVDQIKDFMKHIFATFHHIEITTQNVHFYTFEMIAFIAGLMLPLLLGIFITVFAAEVAQVGLQIATKKFTEGLNFKQIFNPFSGLKKIFFSSRSLFEVAKSIVKMIIIGIMVWQILEAKRDQVMHLVEMPLIIIGEFLVEVCVELIVKVSVIYIIIALMDYFYQKYKFKEDMKMTKHEVKEENKQSEGDPKIKARLKAIMRQRFRKMMMTNAGSADVVITNPTHFAVALKYKHGEMDAPIVVAKGADHLALQIRKIAENKNIPIVEEAPLARALYHNAEINDEIPEDLFKAVAQILAYVYQLRGQPA
jgi:flagellar biosynthesis protein FlhB